MIGGIECEVTSSSETEVTCNVGKVALGDKLHVSLTVIGKGSLIV